MYMCVCIYFASSSTLGQRVGTCVLLESLSSWNIYFVNLYPADISFMHHIMIRVFLSSNQNRIFRNNEQPQRHLHLQRSCWKSILGSLTSSDHFRVTPDNFPCCNHATLIIDVNAWTHIHRCTSGLLTSRTAPRGTGPEINAH